MANKLYEESSIQSIANAIRGKNGSSDTYTVAQMADAITAIPTGTVRLKPYLVRPDAELMKTITFDKMAVADLELTLPAYTTTSQTLIAAAELEETYSISYTDYNWYILQRALTIPEYSLETHAKGRAEYAISAALYEISEIPGSTFHALVAPTTAYTSRSVSVVATGALVRLVYWSSGTAITAYATAAYGCAQGLQTPTLSSGVLTFKNPTFIMRGSTTYFTNTYMNAVTDVRLQYIIEVYRAPKNNLNIDGWGSAQQALHVAECAQSDTHKLI